MTSGVRAAAALGLVVLAGCTPAGVTTDPPRASSQALLSESPWRPESAAESGIVTNVVDGDTLDVQGVGRIRVIGIDTPERGECGFESATQAMSVLVLGRQVSLLPGATEDADRYGLLLRYVDVGTTDAGLSLIEDGWAIARYDSRDGYGRHLRESAYVRADAASEDLGCYSDDTP